MLRRNYIVILAVVLLTTLDFFAQVSYQGPVTGRVDTGAVVSTGTFTDSYFDLEIPQKHKEPLYYDSNPLLIDSDGKDVNPVPYFEDTNLLNTISEIGANTFLLNKWDVQLDNNVIPPDPTMAVGPNHVMVLTNNGTGIRIFDKQGNLLKSISSTAWWSAVWPSQSGDPQIIYDHFSGRWVMVFMQVDEIAQIAGDLIAYSDDDDPFGTWYMYRLPSTLWGDFPQIGFDQEAIYIATNNFTFAGSGQYAKLRIISKSELYNSNAGALTYKDIWNISIPNSGTGVWNLRPSYHYSVSDGHYLVFANRGGGNFYSVYKLTNPTTTPTLTGVNINVPFYGPTPNANQLGGGTPLIETGGSVIRNAPIFRDGYLYAAHSIRNSTNINYSSVKYFKVNVSNNTISESAELGAVGYYYFYPALAADKDGNIAITCSRSGDNEYIGAYYISRRYDDPEGLSGATPLQVGLGNYVKTFGGTNPRNRWGDYMGIFLDPSDEYSMWMFTEYASTGNNYACVVGQVRLKPFNGIYAYLSASTLNFGDTQIGKESDTLTLNISNYGTDDLIITSIPSEYDDFILCSEHAFPIVINTFDSVAVKFLFKPTIFGSKYVIYPIDNNSASFTGINLVGFGYNMNPADENKLYAVSGSQNNGNTILIDKLTGNGVNLGNSNYSDIISLTINKKTKQIFGLRSNSISTSLVRINAELGDAYYFKNIDLPNLFSIAFDTSGNLYATNTTNQIYQIDTLTGFAMLVATISNFNRVSICFNPYDNSVFGVVRNPTGTPKDRVIQINLQTGESTLIGQTGFGVNTTAIAFDEMGVLYGIKGSGTIVSDLFKINTSTGVGTLVGSVGQKDLTGLAYSIGEPSSVEDNNNNTPVAFSLAQNYPNPFNPYTQIKFDLPVNASVKVVVYNLLGETVKEIFAGELNAGTHKLNWNADDKSGNKVSSGIYFYEIRANGQNGASFNDVKKMMLLK